MAQKQFIFGELFFSASLGHFFSIQQDGSHEAECIHVLGRRVKTSTLWEFNKKLLKMAIEIVDFPIKNGGSFHSYVKLPEGTIGKRTFFSMHRARISSQRRHLINSSQRDN